MTRAEPGLPVVDDAELVIVGAGPAGSACAARAVERGLDVLLVDQDEFPRDKPCGDGVTRSGVAYLLRLGLEQLVDSSQPIEGGRVFFPHGPEHRRPYEPRRGHPRFARTIPRTAMDHALRDAALARGARFLRGRVQGPVLEGDRVVGVEIERDGTRSQVSARAFVAADGATSRMRRTCGFAKPPDAALFYAVRQYARTERELDPAFHIYFPIVFDGRGLFGYGWVFPIGAHSANVGIGFLRGGGVGETPPLRPVFARFLEELAGERSRYGAIELGGKPFGSPIAVHFSEERCVFANVLFIGDAAGTVDPLSGEGIAYAFRCGDVAADAAYDLLRTRRATPDLGRRLAHAFPRLGQDVTPLARLTVRATTTTMARPDSAPRGGDAKRQPLANALLEVVEGSQEDPTLRGTPIVELLAQAEPSLAATLEQWNGAMLDTLRTEFPLATEFLHSEFRGGAGPALTATLLAAHAAAGAAGAAGTADAAVRDAALSVELLRLGHATLTKIPHRLTSKIDHVSAGLAVLLGDFCLARSMTLSVPVGRGVPDALSRANRSLCEGQMLDARELHNPDRSVEAYLAAVGRRSAALFELAARLGGMLAGADGATTGCLAAFGRQLGVACQIAEDLGADPERMPAIPSPSQAHEVLLQHVARAQEAIAGLPDGATLHALTGLPLTRAGEAPADVELTVG